MPKPPVAYRLRVPDEVASLIRGLHPSLKSKVKAGLLELCGKPQAGKPLRDELTGLWSYRVPGDLRSQTGEPAKFPPGRT